MKLVNKTVLYLFPPVTYYHDAVTVGYSFHVVNPYLLLQQTEGRMPVAYITVNPLKPKFV
jgi:hypothetical protein